ncbi:Kazal-type serine protease inhibitor family protein [Alkalimarinus alittae]|uniref:Kazal-like domain-containing protein n=1 Tax=Alkalimarinus alittae TaxID=2961619 RepID=A0ABY6MZM1_9ALTE|nr:hypothetical protein [Alkalimarinus alittae]UZE95288.1 hypothetical protein NKI27_14625 [Alkalimarinus alittae]
MKVLAHALGLIGMSCAIMACTATPEKIQVENQCKDPRPQICTMIYMPVCGLDEKGDINTYASGCNACSRADVVGYSDGACEDTAVQ